MPDNYILIIDDDEDDREVLESALREVSHITSYKVARDGEQAFEVLRDNETGPEVIFLDLNMPAMGGFEFLKRLKTNVTDSDIPVIIYTTSSLQKDIDTALKYGAAHFITKQNTFGELCDALRHAFMHVLQITTK
jgi:CheY-like chemotaxis protein